MLILGIGGGLFLYPRLNISKTPPVYQKDTNSIKPTITKTQTSERKSTISTTKKPTNKPTSTTSHKSKKTLNKSAYFKNLYFKIKLAPGWKVSSQIRSTGAVNFVKGRYIFYINPNYYQTSGVFGATFAEIAGGAKGADLVSKVQPAKECLIEKGPTIKGFAEVNVLTGPGADSDICKVPSDGKHHWYFTYYAKNGYLTYLDKKKGRALVITLTYNTDDINKLPVPEETNFKKTILKEVENMVESLEILR